MSAALATLALGAAASAQTTAPAPAPTVPSAAAPAVQQPGQVDLQRLIGRNIQNSRNETIGEIDGVMVDRSGKVQSVIVGVGGFLGLGERQVAINWDALSVGPNGDRVTLDMSKDQLKALPEYRYANRTYSRTVFTDDARGVARPPVAAGTPAPPAVAMAMPSQVGAAKLVGLNIRNAANETIGEIKDIVLGNDGKAREVIVGVGGYLGIGERYVAIAWDQLQLRHDRDNDVLATVSFTKEQLQSLPPYRYDRNLWQRG
ncbi:MAG: PRC-barrel domain-containing protein [Alphaproteobacteria bacterium]|nr:PRC-barrel domain-containing protein [Alphaproteobacteria bacterium]